MPRWVYPGFDRMNRRRDDLIQKKLGAGVTELEARELHMLQEVVGRIAWFNLPLPDPLWRLKESANPKVRKFAKKIDDDIDKDQLKDANEKIYKLMQTLRWVYAKANLTYKEKVAVRLILGDSKWDKYC